MADKVVEIKLEQLEKIVELLAKAYDEIDKVQELLLEIGKEIK